MISWAEGAITAPNGLGWDKRQSTLHLPPIGHPLCLLYTPATVEVLRDFVYTCLVCMEYVFTSRVRFYRNIITLREGPDKFIPPENLSLVVVGLGGSATGSPPFPSGSVS